MKNNKLKWKWNENIEPKGTGNEQWSSFSRSFWRVQVKFFVLVFYFSFQCHTCNFHFHYNTAVIPNGFYMYENVMPNEFYMYKNVESIRHHSCNLDHVWLQFTSDQNNFDQQKNRSKIPNPRHNMHQMQYRTTHRTFNEWNEKRTCLTQFRLNNKFSK